MTELDLPADPSESLGNLRFALAASVLLGLALITATVLLLYAPRETRGSAVVVAAGRVEVRATDSGIVRTVSVQEGDSVNTGQELYDTWTPADRAKLDDLTAAREGAISEYLLNYSEDARAAVADLTTQLAHEDSRQKRRVVTTERAGLVSSIRIRPGQALAPGQLVATLHDLQPSFSLLVLLPGDSISTVAVGQRVTAELSGHPGSEIEAIVAAMGDTVLSAAEASKIVGEDAGTVAATSSDYVIVRCDITRVLISAGSQAFALKDGMRGTARTLRASASSVTGYLLHR